MRGSYYVPRSPFSFAKDRDGHGLVAVEYTGRSRHVVVPSVHQNQPVVGVGPGVFEGRANIVTVTLPNTVRFLGRRAFYGCTRLLSVVLGTGLQDIGPDAFRHCEALVSVILPPGMRRVAPRAFAQCGSLSSITVHPGNPCFCDIDGVLFSKDRRLLLQYPAGRREDRYQLPPGTRGIAADAFPKATSVLRANGWLHTGEPAAPDTNVKSCPCEQLF